MSTTKSVNTTSIHGTPSTHALPPPATPLVVTGLHGGRGWLSGDVIGFRGFGSSGEAGHAAWVAHRTLAHRQDDRSAGWRPTLIDPEPLTLSRDGDRETILADGRPIATLLRPDPDHPGEADSFGFEITVAGPTDELTMRSSSQVVFRALRRSGIRWASTPAEPRRETPPSYEALPRRGSRDAAPTRPAGASVGEALVGMTALSLLIVLVAMATWAFAATQPIGIPMAVLALTALGAVAVGEAERRSLSPSLPGRIGSVRRMHADARPSQAGTTSGRAG